MGRDTYLSLCVEEFERKLILSELLRYGWNRVHTARSLGISYRSLTRKIERFGLQPPESTAQAS